MLKRPSSRRKSSSDQIELNLVPIIDAMVTMIGFMLFTTSFLSIVSIESNFPVVSREVVKQKLKEKPLQLTISVREKDTEIWSPFNRFAPKTIPHLTEAAPDTKAIHEALLEIKQKFPTETNVVIVPSGGTSYDVLISLMDTMRNIEPTDPPIYTKNDAGADVVLKALFPDVIFGNLLGDS